MDSLFGRSDSSSNNGGNKPAYGSGSSFQNVGAIDLNKLAPLYGLPQKKSNGPEYIPYNTRGRDFYGRLSFNTGVFWLTGFIGGGSFGLVEGWRTAISPNYKIRFNNVLNSVSKRGSTFGSSFGVIAFLHTTGVWVADNIEIEEHTDQPIATPLFAGFMTGALYKSMKGVRAAALAGTIGAAASCAYWYGSSYISDVVIGKGGKY